VVRVNERTDGGAEDFEEIPHLGLLAGFDAVLGDGQHGAVVEDRKHDRRDRREIPAGGRVQVVSV
jgi:hypothetical protein